MSIGVRVAAYQITSPYLKFLRKLVIPNINSCLLQFSFLLALY
ncbi:MAG: hypothetical protein HFJ17_06465 [Clostridia bacterium]|nr:hypothetical protein [Clostridia bacterium]